MILGRKNQTDFSTDFSVDGINFHLNILGDFNIYNALAAIAVGQFYGVSLATCQKALEKVRGIPGRMEIVNKNHLVIVDYDHTPVQLENAYKSLSNSITGGKRDLLSFQLKSPR